MVCCRVLTKYLATSRVSCILYIFLFKVHISLQIKVSFLRAGPCEYTVRGHVICGYAIAVIITEFLFVRRNGNRVLNEAHCFRLHSLHAGSAVDVGFSESDY